MKVFWIATLALLLSSPTVTLANRAGGPQARPRKLLVRLEGKITPPGFERPKRAAFTVERIDDGVIVRGFETHIRAKNEMRVAKGSSSTFAITTAFGKAVHAFVDYRDTVVRVSLRHEGKQEGDTMSLSGTGIVNATMVRGQSREVINRTPIAVGIAANLPFDATALTTTAKGKPTF
jgi:hypothetical protein